MFEFVMYPLSFVNWEVFVGTFILFTFVFNSLIAPTTVLLVVFKSLSFLDWYGVKLGRLALVIKPLSLVSCEVVVGISAYSAILFPS